MTALKTRGATMATSQAAAGYNSFLKLDLCDLPAHAANGGLHFLDTYGWLDTAVADPTRFRAHQRHGPLLRGTLHRWPATLLATPNSYLFWDQLHPTTAVHELLAEEAWAFVPSPSPGVGLFSLGLLAFLGLKTRSRDRKGA